MSFPPAGTCLVNQTSGDVGSGATLRGVLLPSASLAQPKQTYSNGTQSLAFSPVGADYSTSLGGTLNSVTQGMNSLGAAGSFTMDPGGPDQTAVPLAAVTPPSWTRPAAIISIARDAPLTLPFTPGEAAAPTGITIQSYAAATNSTVQISCLAPPGASSFTISADTLANLPPTYLIADGSYTNLYIGTLGFNRTASFSNGLVSKGILLLSSWVGQTAVVQ